MEMACPQRTDFEKAHSDALRNFEESLSAARADVTKKDTVEKTLAVQSTYDALTGQIEGCPICEGT